MSTYLDYIYAYLIKMRHMPQGNKKKKNKSKLKLNKFMDFSLISIAKTVALHSSAANVIRLFPLRANLIRFCCSM